MQTALTFRQASSSVPIHDRAEKAAEKSKIRVKQGKSYVLITEDLLPQPNEWPYRSELVKPPPPRQLTPL